MVSRLGGVADTTKSKLIGVVDAAKAMKYNVVGNFALSLPPLSQSSAVSF